MRLKGTRSPAPALLLALGLTGCREAELAHSIIPVPASVELTAEDSFLFTPETRITVPPGVDEAARIAGFLADLVGNTTETRPEIVEDTVEGAGPTVRLALDGSFETLGPEGYELLVGPDRVEIKASSPAGLFYGVQTLRLLLPPLVEYTAAYPRPLTVATGRIVDAPRFEWRGAMLDVSRHFLPPGDVKRFIDLMALYKLNRLHLHLSDDQGWRVEIPGWPNLTDHGASTEVGGREGGYYTADEYEDLARYAQERYVVVVPEIDMPGHTNAALASYPELNCDGVSPELYTGTEVGFSALCPESEDVYAFLDDIVREIAARTPGPYFHVGGDEVQTLSEEQYGAFMLRAQEIVASHGKHVVGWDEVALVDLHPESFVQLWRPLWRGEEEEDWSPETRQAAQALRDGLSRAISQGGRVILSPADRLYLDMKYDTATALGLVWAGTVDARTTYDWRVEDLFESVPEGAIAGVEAPLWSETLGTLDDFEYMAFPRLAGVAELGWSPQEARDWKRFRRRLGAQSTRWAALGVNFMRDPGVPWDVGAEP